MLNIAKVLASTRTCLSLGQGKVRANLEKIIRDVTGPKLNGLELGLIPSLALRGKKKDYIKLHEQALAK